MLSSRKNLPRLILSSGSLICLVRSVSQSWISKKERFNFVDTDITFHNTNFTTLNVALSSYETVLPCAWQKKVWPCVWKGNSLKSTFLHHRDFELWVSRDHPCSPPFQNFTHKIDRNIACFCSFCKFFTSYIATKDVGKLTVIQTSTVPHNSVQISCASERLLPRPKK